MRRSSGLVIAFWIVTVRLLPADGFTAYAQLRLPQVAEAFTHLGFPDYFRVELSWAKLLGVVLLLAPVPARLKEWAYAGFAIDLGSALIAHSRWATARRRGAGPRAPACSGGSRTSSGAACRPRRRVSSMKKHDEVGRERRPVGIGADLETDRRARGLARKDAERMRQLVKEATRTSSRRSSG
jgi:hypothetical protein